MLIKVTKLKANAKLNQLLEVWKGLKCSLLIIHVDYLLNYKNLTKYFDFSLIIGNY